MTSQGEKGLVTSDVATAFCACAIAVTANTDTLFWSLQKISSSLLEENEQLHNFEHINGRSADESREKA